MSLFRRIVGALVGAPSEPRTRILLDTEIDAREHQEEQRRPSRGRRGGRGRGGREDAANRAPEAPAAPAAGERGGRSDRRGAPDRNRDAQRRWVRPPRESLDAPLPEDVAFRPAAEGGDPSILPVHRRPPPGSRRPGRVFFAGTTGQYVARDGAVTPPPEPTATAEHLGDGAEGGEAPEAAEQKRRRRGRRGGRGRRRGAEGDDSTTIEGAEAAIALGRPTGDGEYAPDEPDTGDEAGEWDEPDADDDDEGDELAAEVASSPSRRTFPRRDAAELPAAFRALGLGEELLQIVARDGFSTPTPIQASAIPVLLAGRDVVGVAQTGTGKTLAFGLPMFARLDPSRRAVQAIVLVPTRELAQQVLDVLRNMGEPLGFDTVGLLGGRALDRDFRALERRPHVVVGTPGRVIDHLHRGTLALNDVRYAVLDEADQMLDIGFLPDITRILSRTPRARQTALFSATMPHAILRLVRRYMENPETVAFAPELTSAETVEQIYFEVAQRDKVHGLHELIERELKGRTLVFSRTRRGVDYLASQLSDAGVRVGALHGDMDQRRRDQVVHGFREGELDILIATNVAARGLDIPEITHVVNFDVPQNPEEYVHRIGRTGRAGREGKAITFVCERDIAEFDVLLTAFGDRLRKEDLRLYERQRA